MKSKVLSFIAISVIAFTGCSNANQNNQNQAVTPQSTQYVAPPGLDQQVAKPQEGDQIATLDTDLGTIKFKLFTKDIPTLTGNFISLANAGKYDGVPFHRVVKDFMIQTGDFTNKNGTGGYSYKGPDTFLPNEINGAYHHLYGTVSMAKTSAPVSIGSQFFIVTNKDGTPFLDGSYSPIGQVYEGMDVAEAIANLQVAGTEKPGKIINIKKVTITQYVSGNK
jgi:cyclophilin family peptidyl-prolyl cis-trans isomerase